MDDEVSSDLVSFDTERAVERAAAVTDDGLRIVAELTSKEYRIVHVSDAFETDFAAADADFDEVADEFHRYEALDFFEQGTFADLLPTVESVTAFATFTNVGVLVRVVAEDDEGLFLSVERDADVTALVNELEPIVVGE